jgi:hypothetical protein
MSDNVPEQPANSFRIILKLNQKLPRIDTVLLEAIRNQEDNLELKRISRTAYKALFNEKKILIKGQAAKPSSALAAGTTYVDILGYE